MNKKMNQIDYSLQYTIGPKIDITLEKDHVGFIFSPAHNIHSCLFEINHLIHNLGNGHCMTLLADHDQSIKLLDSHSRDIPVVCILTLPKEQISRSAFKRFYNEDNSDKSVVTFSNSRIEFLLKELTSSKKDHICKFKTYGMLFELISLQLERTSNESDGADGQIHYDKILYTKRLIEENLSHTYTIPELAKLAGTNEQYLKKYFKLYIGTTISHYTLEVKMSYAKHLLMTGKHRVADIARMVGYKHSTHFTTAFKRYFGFIPNSLRY